MSQPSERSCTASGAGRDPTSSGTSPLISGQHPTPGLERADDGLPALMHVDVLDPNRLLPFALVPVQALQQGGIGARELVAALTRHEALPGRTGRHSAGVRL